MSHRSLPLRSILPLAVAATLMPLAHAQPLAEEESYFAPLPTVLTASRMLQSQEEAAGAMTVLDRDFIRATGYRDLARLFRLVPGMQVGQERGNTQWVTYHGLSTTNPSEMQVLIDGRSVYSAASFGGVDWNSLPITLDEIERIEIVRGANPVSFGANAFFGVINIITRHTGAASAPRVSVAAGWPGVRDIEVADGLETAHGSVRANVSSQHDHGYSGLFDGRNVTRASLRGDYQLSARDELSLRLAGSQAERDTGYPDSVNQNNAERTQYSQNYSVHGQWRRTEDQGEEWLLGYYRNQERIDERWLARSVPEPGYPQGAPVPVDMGRRAVRDNLELQYRHHPLESVQAVWGGEARSDRIDAPLLYGGQSEVTTQLLRGFGNIEWKLAPRWQLTGGAALERYEHEGVRASPRSFLNWQLAPGDTLRAGYARAWSQRPTFEREGDVRAMIENAGVVAQQPYVPNPELRQARVDSFELGYLGRFRPMSATLDVRVFRERIHDFIYRQAAFSSVPALIPWGAQYVNAGEPVTLTGVEYQLRFVPWRDASVLFNHTVMRAESAPELQHRVAPYTASLTWIQGWGQGWQTTLTGLRMGPLAGGDGIVPITDYTARPYTTVDARIAWQTRRSGRLVECSLNAINLGGPHQEIADRSQQSLARDVPANRVSPMVYLGLAFEF